MPSSLHQEEGVVDQVAPQLMVLDEASAELSEIKAPLELRGYRVVQVNSGGEALNALRRTRPALAIVAYGPVGRGGSTRNLTEWRGTARQMGIPVLAVVDSGADLRSPSLEEFDDWVVRGSSTEELNARVARLLRRRAAGAAVPARPGSSPIDAKFSSLVVHDLRTPLNVIGLSLHMIEQVLPKPHPEIEQDFRFVEENLRQIERMLTQLGDYARLFELNQPLAVHAFDPRRFVEEFLDSRTTRPGAVRPTVSLDVQNTCPTEVTLDQRYARMALEYALINAEVAAHDAPVAIRLQGTPQRWIIEIAIDRPPPASVHSLELGPQSFERLCGCTADRRGMDLAIAARVSQIFGGTARIEANAGRGTTIILDWPTRIAGQS